METARKKLESIQDEIRRGVFRSARNISPDNWSGAGVVFQRAKPVRGRGTDTNSGLKFVVTLYAAEAGWLLDKLEDVFIKAGLIKSTSITELHLRLANAAIRYQKHAKKGESATLLLAAMLAEAKIMLAELQKKER